MAQEILPTLRLEAEVKTTLHSALTVQTTIVGTTGRYALSKARWASTVLCDSLACIVSSSRPHACRMLGKSNNVRDSRAARRVQR